MRLEEVLPAFREGKKIRRKSWESGEYIEFCRDDPEYGNCILDHEGVADRYFCFELDWAFADDWEVVPEPKKFEAWVNLYADGRAIINGGLISTDPLKPSPKVVECRKIEWEVGE